MHCGNNRAESRIDALFELWLFDARFDLLACLALYSDNLGNATRVNCREGFPVESVDVILTCLSPRLFQLFAQFGRFPQLWGRPSGIGAGPCPLSAVAVAGTSALATRGSTATRGDGLYHLAGRLRRSTNHQAPGNRQGRSNQIVVVLLNTQVSV